jgi:hypothetical protein
MRTLVISDIHNRIVTAQRLIDTVPHDSVVLLGDYFDSFGDSVDMANNTAVWLRDVALPNPKITFLLGNHDTHYFWPHHHYFRCSGYTDMKRDAIRKELNRENTNNFERFKFYHIEQGFFFAHAGLDNRPWKDMKRVFTEDGSKTKLEFVDEVLSHWVIQARKDIGMDRRVELLGAGWDRGGLQQVGGINWVDFSNLSPVQGINQIVGHTPHRVPDVKIQKQGGAITVKDIFEYYDIKHFPACKDPLSINYALDTHSKHYIVIEDGEVQVWDVQHNMKVQDLQEYAIPESPMSGLPGLRSNIGKLPDGAWEEYKPKQDETTTNNQSS